MHSTLVKRPAHDKLAFLEYYCNKLLSSACLQKAFPGMLFIKKTMFAIQKMISRIGSNPQKMSYHSKHFEELPQATRTSFEHKEYHSISVFLSEGRDDALTLRYPFPTPPCTS